MTTAEKIVQRVELKCGNNLDAKRLEDAVFDVFCRMVERGEIAEDLDLIMAASGLYQEKNHK